MVFDYVDMQKVYAFENIDPHVKIEIVDASEVDYWARIESGDIDLAYTARPPKELGLSYIELVDDAFSLIMSSDNALASRETVRFEHDLTGCTLLYIEPTIKEAFAPYAREYGFELKLGSTDRNALCAMIEVGDGCFITLASLANRLTVGSVVAKELLHVPMHPNPCIVFKSDLTVHVYGLLNHILSFHDRNDAAPPFGEKSLWVASF